MTLTHRLPSAAEIHHSWIYFQSSVYLCKHNVQLGPGTVLHLPAITTRGICVNLRNADDTSRM